MKLLTIIALSLSPIVVHAAATSKAASASPETATASLASTDLRFDRVEAYSTDVWNLTLVGGQVAHIDVDGDHDTDLDFFLYDENGCLVDSDLDGTDIYRGRITPRWTGSFRLEIRNLGGVYNAYRLQVD